ncbi:MAG: hypothetical protein AB8E15_02425 [Bdellovibrionales bacterium]
MANVLVFSNNPAVTREIESSFLEYKFDFKVSHGAMEYFDYLDQLFENGTDKKSLIERFDLVIVDSSIFIKRCSTDWLVYFKELITKLEEKHKVNLEITNLPAMLIDKDEGFDYIHMALNSGYADYILSKPIDGIILIQKINLILSKSRSTLSLVHEMPIARSTQISLFFETEKISIFGAVIKAYQPIMLDAITTLNLDIGTEEPLLLTSRCFKTEKHPDEPKLYRIHLQFLALNDHLRSAIKNWMNKEYAAEKIKQLPDE